MAAGLLLCLKHADQDMKKMPIGCFFNFFAFCPHAWHATQINEEKQKKLVFRKGLKIIYYTFSAS